jgi:D-tyrosyl-tRNA(Tyr) deacylase
VIALLQRVASARVLAGGETLGAIGTGLLVFIGVERGDGEREADRLLDRVLGYRIFPDCAGKMNASVSEVGGGLLLVPQFTLAADTRKGMRPSFSPAAPPEEGARLFGHLLGRAEARHAVVAAGRFGADMKVASVNDGPVTFWLRAAPREPAGHAAVSDSAAGGSSS